MDFEKKNRQVDLSIGHVWPSVRRGPDTQKFFFIFFSVEFNLDHFKPSKIGQIVNNLL
jgi:hypothetical protein